MAPGRTWEIPVTAGVSGSDPSDTAIQISRLGIGSGSRAQQIHEVPLTPTPQGRSSSSIYEVPPTPPTGRSSKTRNIAIVEPVPRLDLGARSNAIFEVPPTPPGAEQRSQGNRAKIVREISVGPAQPQPATGTRNIAVSAKNDAPAAPAEEVLPRASADESSQHQAKETSPVKKHSESSFMDFSLFLIKNAMTRAQIRGSLSKDLAPGAASEMEEDLEALLLKWEAAQAEEEAASEEKEKVHYSVLPMFPSLNELPMMNFINSEGKIRPPCDPDTPVSVFAVFDRLKKIQYVGVSKNITNTLRKLMGRRPNLCYYYKLYNFPCLDNPQPHSLKQRWISELGTVPPPGNSDPVQKKQWEQAVDVGSFPEKGQALAAAIERAKNLIQAMVERGLKEEMIYDPALMELGRCDVLEASTPAAPKGKHTVIKTPYGGSIEYYICYNDKSKTISGWKYDVSVNKDNEETRHFVTCGSKCPGNLSEEGFLELIMGFLLHKGVPRSKESRNGFSMGNFSLSEVVQEFDDFKPWFPRSQGKKPGVVDVLV